MTRFRLPVLFALCLPLAFVACDADDPFIAEQGELIVEDVVIGTGEIATVDDVVRISYTGRLLNGEVFDESAKNDGGFIDLGLSLFVPGFRDGVAGMREGGQRRLEIPPHLAYGARSIQTGENYANVPSNATLFFDVELLRVNP